MFSRPCNFLHWHDSRRGRINNVITTDWKSIPHSGITRHCWSETMQRSHYGELEVFYLFLIYDTYNQLFKSSASKRNIKFACIFYVEKWIFKRYGKMKISVSDDQGWLQFLRYLGPVKHPHNLLPLRIHWN